MDRAFVTRYDFFTEAMIKEAKTKPVLINYSIGKNRYEKTPDQDDLQIITKVSEWAPSKWVPTNRLREGGETRRNDPIGITHTHLFYTIRNLITLSEAYDHAVKLGKEFMFWFTSTLAWTGRENRLHLGNYFGKKGGVITSLRGTWYVASLQVETCVIERLRLRSRIHRAKSGDYHISNTLISTQSSDYYNSREGSLDYIFVDPPFGSNLREPLKTPFRSGSSIV